MADVRITWTGSISGTYEVQYKLASSMLWIEPSGSPVTGTELSIAGLSANTAYIFRVRSVCAGEVSPWQYQSFTTPDAACAVITNLTLSDESNTTVTVSFTASGTAVNGYIIEYKRSDALSWSSSPTITSTTYTIAGLTAGTSYDFRVISLCAAGASSTSGPATTETTPIYEGCSGISVTSVAIVVDGTNYKATWTNTGGTPSGHNIEYSINGGSSWSTLSSSIVTQALTNLVYQLPPSVTDFPKTHMLRITPSCFDASTGTPGTGTYTAPPDPEQFIIFDNNLTEGSITSISIDGSPNVLSAPIAAQDDEDYYQTGIFGAHTITGLISPMLNGTTLLIEHVRSASVIHSGNVTYSSGFTLSPGWSLLDQDRLRVTAVSVPTVTTLNATTTSCFGGTYNNYIVWNMALSAAVPSNKNYGLRINWTDTLTSATGQTMVTGTILSGASTGVGDCTHNFQIGASNYSVNSVCIIYMDAGVNKSTFAC